jgi:hypothetical protein
MSTTEIKHCQIFAPKMTMSRQYTTASMPTRGLYSNETSLQQQYETNHHGYYYFMDNATNEDLLISQPLPNTVKIVNEKPTSNKKDSVLLGWYE